MRLFYILAAIAAFLPSSISASHPGRDIQSEPAESQAAIGKVGPVHISVRENGVIGTLVVPDTKRPYPGVLRIGGSEGGISITDAETIASEGYAVLALAYFGMEGLPAELEEVPLEYFGKAIAWMKGSPYSIVRTGHHRNLPGQYARPVASDNLPGF